jgi:hypothetical protein
MNLSELISRLGKEDQMKIVHNGFGPPHSYRGDYAQVSFEPEQNTTVGAMFTHAQSALNKTFTGYKGGNYVMTGHSEVYLAPYGDTGEEISDDILDTMLGTVRGHGDVVATILGMQRVDRQDVGATEERRIEKAKIVGYNEAIADIVERLGGEFVPKKEDETLEDLKNLIDNYWYAIRTRGLTEIPEETAKLEKYCKELAEKYKVM